LHWKNNYSHYSSDCNQLFLDGRSGFKQCDGERVLLAFLNGAQGGGGARNLFFDPKLAATWSSFSRENSTQPGLCAIQTLETHTASHAQVISHRHV